MAVVAGPESGTSIILASAVRTATSTTVVVPPLWAKGMIVVINTTLDAASASHVPTFQVLDGGGAYDELIATLAAVAAVGDQSALFYPTGQLTAAKEYEGTITFNMPIPREFQLTMTAADGDAITYSVLAHWLP